MTHKIAFLTTIFPSNRPYFDTFFSSLLRSTYKQFDVIVVNDGCHDVANVLKKFRRLNVIDLPYRDTPAKNREFGINFACQQGYDVIVFGDSDDYFEENRIEVSLSALRHSDIVVNDISLFTNSDGIYCDNYFSSRVADGETIQLSFILDKNIFGLSNTAVNTAILGDVSFFDDIIAVDWYLYSILLLRKNKAVFTNKTRSYYRQHLDNSIGMGPITTDGFLTGISAKLKHYRILSSESDTYKALYRDTSKLLIKAQNCRDIESLIDRQIDNPLWWEQVHPSR